MCRREGRRREKWMIGVKGKKKGEEGSIFLLQFFQLILGHAPYTFQPHATRKICFPDNG